MTETVHALPDAVPPRDSSRGPEGSAVTFNDLIYAHFAWFRAARNGHRSAAEAAYRDTLRRFEAQHGQIVRAFWCTHLESGIALTESNRRLRQNALTLHRETDWATRGSPSIAAQLHRCDDLAIRARTVLSGVRQRICLELVAASAGHLLSLVDKATAPDSARDLDAAVKEEAQALDRAERYYRQAANGQAEIIYFAGMATVAVAVSFAALLVLHFQWRVAVAALVAGAVGAVVSVIQRINEGSFRVHYDVGRPYAFFLGGLRPLIGAAFAIAIAFTFASGIIHLPLATTDRADERMALVVISFLAGFSERWAKDTLATVAHQTLADPAAAKTPPMP
jgi:hypothetical protein